MTADGAIQSGVDALQEVRSAVAAGARLHQDPSLARSTEGFGLLSSVLPESFCCAVQLFLEAFDKVRLQLGDHLGGAQPRGLRLLGYWGGQWRCRPGLLGLLQALLPRRLDLGRVGVEKGRQGLAGLAADRVIAPVGSFPTQPPAGQGDFTDGVLDGLGAPALAHQQEQPGGSQLMAGGVPPVQIGDRALSCPEEEALGAPRGTAFWRGLGLGPSESPGLGGLAEFSREGAGRVNLFLETFADSINARLVRPHKDLTHERLYEMATGREAPAEGPLSVSLKEADAWARKWRIPFHAANLQGELVHRYLPEKPNSNLKKGASVWRVMRLGKKPGASAFTVMP